MLWHIACIMWVPANHTQTSRELQVDWLSVPISSVLIHVARSCCVAVVYLMMYAFLSKTIWMNVLQCGFHLTMQAAALLAHIYFCLDNSSSYLFFFVWTALFQVGGLHCKGLIEKMLLPSMGHIDRGHQHVFQRDYNFTLPRNG